MRYKYTHDMSGRKLPPYMSLNIMLWRQIFFSEWTRKVVRVREDVWRQHKVIPKEKHLQNFTGSEILEAVFEVHLLIGPEP